MKKNNIDQKRRDFLKLGFVAGSGLLIGIHLPGCTEAANQSVSTPEIQDDEFKANAWIKINSDGMITVTVSHSEMGQGISTAISMIVAEELEADWSKVRFEMAPVEDVYKHPKYGIQWTVSSMSIHASWDLWRKAGASARQLLILSAARFWGVSVNECLAENSTVIHKPSSQTINYGELIDKTDGLSLPENVRLKRPDEFKIIGKSVLRLDSHEKIDGSAVFGTDVKVPGMLIATIVHPPVFGAGIKSLDAREALTMPGIKNVLTIETGVAIVAETFWQASSAIPSLNIEWEKSDNRHVSTRQLFKRWKKLGAKEGKVFFEEGDVKPVFESTSRVVEATYDLPYQAHATPEPMNCTASVTKTGCEIWVPTQNQKGAQEIAARITGLDNEQIRVHTTFLGCGFGRRALVDYVGEAVEISRKINAPVKLIWTREEDIQHDFYRPATHNVMKATIDSHGRPTAWLHRIVGADVFAQAMPKVISGMMPDSTPRFLKNMATSLAETFLPRIIAGKKAIKSAGPLPYRIPNVQVEFINDDPGIPIGWWRSVAPSANCFAVECFIDELAAAGKRDPYELRIELLGANPRLQHVVRKVAEMANWYEPPPNGTHRGIAAHDFQSTMMAYVAEVSVNDFNEIMVHRVFCAVDCGIAVNPGNIEAQVISALAFGLTATIKSSITFREGKVEQGNFDDFPVLRMDEMPRVEVFVVPSNNPPTGIGEVGVPIIAPAVANAVYAATGKRLRSLPLRLDEA